MVDSIYTFASSGAKHPSFNVPIELNSPSAMDSV